MKLYGFMHKETGEILRFIRFDTDDAEFGTTFLFSESKYCAPWLNQNREDLEYIISAKSIHASKSVFYQTPDTSEIDITKYEIREWILN